MGKDDVTLLIADITTQMSFVKTALETLEDRLQGVQPDDPVRLESIAYQLHNLYNAVEDLLKLVAAHFENHIADPARWHSELLYRMSQDITDIRPALLSDKSYRLLNGLRGFRHFFRHAYNVPIEFEELRLNIERAQQLYPQLTQDVDQFLQSLTDELTDSP